jgi:flavin reductase (DIM6/NTAB) family NADH-FMN oxidoreductase RutF
VACSKKEIIPSGDHSIVIGSVNNFEILNQNKKPLIFWSGEFINN